ncbi:MAG: DUF1905 domain-containing protein [Candidatus Kapaibacteriota bacterium]
MTTYTFTSAVWRHEGPAAWHFVSLPLELSRQTRELFSIAETGWGRLQARAAIGAVEWSTAIWFDTKRSTYLLPIKADVRRRTGVESGMVVEVTVSV